MELVKQVCQYLTLTKKKKKDGLVLDAPHCLPLYGFRIYGHLLEGIKFQAFSSCSPFPRLDFRFSFFQFMTSSKLYFF